MRELSCQKFLFIKNKKGVIMKKYLSILTIMILCSSSSVFANNIAVVDLQKIVSNSSQVKQLKQEHAKKIAELRGMSAQEILDITCENAKRFYRI